MARKNWHQVDHETMAKYSQDGYLISNAALSVQLAGLGIGSGPSNRTMLARANMGERAIRATTRTRATPFLDSMSSTPLGAWGLTRMKSAYSGACCNVRRVSDSAVLDIPFGSDGIVDTNLMIAFAGSSTLVLVTLYDQIGANHLTQSNTAKQPTVDLKFLFNGVPTIQFIGTNAFLTIPSGISITSRANCSVWECVALQTNRDGQRIFDLGASAGTFAVECTPFSAFSVQPVIDNSYQTFGTMATIPSANPMVVGLNSSGSSAVWYNGATSTSKSAFSAGAAVGGSFPTATGTANHEAFALVIFNAALSATDVSLIQYGLAASYSLSNTYDANVSLHGDSITAGIIGYGYNYKKLLSEYLPPNISIFSTGKSGEYQSAEVSDAATYIDPLLKSGKTNVAVMLGGVNDIKFGLVSLTTLQSQVTTWANARKAAGWKTVVGTIYAYNVGVNGWTSGMESVRTGYNAWLRSQVGLLIDGVADFDSDPALVPISVADAPDNLHPSLSGYRKAAPILAAAIYGLLPTV